jgi:glycosyltransferase involved in cell wall biosynthesis
LFGVAPSRLEGWGYCASEGLDFGIPVIISTDRALREATGGLMPAIDADDRVGWYAEIRRMTEDGAYRAALCQRIASTHRPTAAAASWASIKDALHDRVADDAAKQER